MGLRRGDTTLSGAVAEAFAFLGYVVHQDVLAEALGGGVEDAAFVHFGDLVDELFEVVVAVEHEGVDDDVFLGAAAHFFQRLADGDRARGVGEVGAALAQTFSLLRMVNL